MQASILLPRFAKALVGSQVHLTTSQAVQVNIIYTQNKSQEPVATGASI